MLWAERGRHKFNVELRGACVYLRRLVKVSHLYGHVLVSCSARVGSVCSMCSEQLVQDAPHHHCTAFHHLEGAFAIGDGMAWHGMVGKMHSEITGNRTQVICLRCLPMSMVAGLAVACTRLLVCLFVRVQIMLLIMTAPCGMLSVHMCKVQPTFGPTAPEHEQGHLELGLRTKPTLLRVVRRVSCGVTTAAAVATWRQLGVALGRLGLPNLACDVEIFANVQAL